MPNKFAIIFSNSAVTDLEEIRSWYIEQKVPASGEEILRKIIHEVESLSDFPEIGRMVPEFALPRLREIILPPFRIVYRTNNSSVNIVRIWRSERLLKLS